MTNISSQYWVFIQNISVSKCHPPPCCDENDAVLVYFYHIYGKWIKTTLIVYDKLIISKWLKKNFVQIFHKCINLIIMSSHLASWYLNDVSETFVTQQRKNWVVRLYLEQLLSASVQTNQWGNGVSNSPKGVISTLCVFVCMLCKTKWFPPSHHTCRRLPLVSSFSTTSDISNSLRGRGIFLLAAMVFSRPGSKVVRATWWWQTVVRLDTQIHSFRGERSALFWKNNTTTYESVGTPTVLLNEYFFLTFLVFKHPRVSVVTVVLTKKKWIN